MRPPLALALFLLVASGTPAARATDVGLEFDAGRFTTQSTTVGGTIVVYRAYEGLVYVRRPVDAVYQRMNVYVPAAYFEGASAGGFDAKTAPIFLPNSVGGYMPARPGAPAMRPDGTPNAALLALSKGYVVAWPGARGRTLQDPSGRFIGKAPSVIVDLKAAVRYLRFNDARMPGNAERIVSNGTSAGGAVSALLGASGNHPDFEPSLEELGAADARDDIFAVSAYCPITNLEHADMAYEWQFLGVNEYTRFAGRPGVGPGGSGGPVAIPPAAPAGAAPPPGIPPGGPGAGPRGPAQGTMTAEQIALSQELASLFPAYVNGLVLKDRSGRPLTLGPSGDGTFRDYVTSFLVASAERAMAEGKDVSGATWLRTSAGKVTGVEFAGYARAVARMKVTPAFDAVDLTSPENDLFGSGTVKARHFTAFGQAHSRVQGTLADAPAVRMMNAMSYVGTPQATNASHWRIRHGAADRDTSLAVPVMLATRLANAGRSVDLALPWGQGHGGDYDLADLFEWMGSLLLPLRRPVA